MENLLSVEDLCVDFETRSGTFHALKHINLTIAPGEAVAVVGESGSGKSTLAYSILQYLARNGRVSGGRIVFDDRDLSGLTSRDLRRMRGSDMSVVFQDPATSFNPTLTIGHQVEEAVRVHTALSPREVHTRAVELLRRVGLPDPETMMDKYPHQLSGGEKQRALIAAAIVTDPKLLIMDEPTTALDITTATSLVEQLQELKKSLGVAILYITHDLSIMAQIADRAYVMEHGVVVEEGQVEQIITAPRHPYTQKLLASVPEPENATAMLGATLVETPETLLKIRNLAVNYEMKTKSGRFNWATKRSVSAVRDIDIDIGRGETVGLIGESGSGKSTIARALAGLNPFVGEVRLGDTSYGSHDSFDRRYRRDVQMIFQHPDLSLNPRIKVFDLIARPLKLLGAVPTAELATRVEEITKLVQLSTDLLDRYTFQLSGGQKQRVAIARAFITRPKLVICDEITSGLDVTVQKSIMELLAQLQEQFGTSYLFITHDINLIRSVASRIYTMYFGQIVENRRLSDPLLPPPYHPYTEALVKAALSPRRALGSALEPIRGEIPSRLSPPAGCAFASRCPRRIGPVCDETAPTLARRTDTVEMRCLLETERLETLPVL
ncbi:dipeptide ABC transporter ATP-binding protein [Martelella sp. AMO21009]